MSDRPAITLTFQSANLSDVQLQADIEELLPQLQEIAGVTGAELVTIDTAPEGSKAFGGFVLGAVRFMVENSKILTGLVGLSNTIFANGKVFELTVESARGNKFSAKAKNLAELEQMQQMAEDFLNRQG